MRRFQLLLCLFGFHQMKAASEVFTCVSHWSQPPTIDYFGVVACARCGVRWIKRYPSPAR